MRSEREIQADILIAIGSRSDARLWRSNAGRFHVVDRPCRSCASRARWIEGAPTGSADLTGIHHGRRIEIEVKSATGRHTDEQKNWESMIRTQGGIYILARSVDEALAGLNAMGATL